MATPNIFGYSTAQLNSNIFGYNIANNSFVTTRGNQTVIGTKIFESDGNVYFGDGSNLTGIIVPAPTNMVTTDGVANQTITGRKTFSNPANAFTGTFTGDGSNITGIPTVANTVTLDGGQTITGVKTITTNMNFTNAGNRFSLFNSGTSLDVTSNNSTTFGFTGFVYNTGSTSALVISTGNANLFKSLALFYNTTKTLCSNILIASNYSSMRINSANTGSTTASVNSTTGIYIGMFFNTSAYYLTGTYVVSIPTSTSIIFSRTPLANITTATTVTLFRVEIAYDPNYSSTTESFTYIDNLETKAIQTDLVVSGGYMFGRTDGIPFSYGSETYNRGGPVGVWYSPFYPIGFTLDFTTTVNFSAYTSGTIYTYDPFAANSYSKLTPGVWLCNGMMSAFRKNGYWNASSYIQLKWTVPVGGYLVGGDLHYNITCVGNDTGNDPLTGLLPSQIFIVTTANTINASVLISAVCLYGSGSTLGNFNIKAWFTKLA